MSHVESVQELIKNLGQAVGLPDLALDANNLCSVCLDDKMVVNLQYHEASNALIMHACAGMLTPETDNHATFRKLLEGNCFWKDTAGATLGIDSESKLIIPSYAIPLPMPQPDHLQPMLLQFVDVLEHWIKILDTTTTPQSA